MGGLTLSALRSSHPAPLAARGSFTGPAKDVYTDPALLVVAGAMEALPELSLSGEAQAGAKQAAQ